jgi:hypothetical protein
MNIVTCAWCGRGWDWDELPSNTDSTSPLRTIDVFVGSDEKTGRSWNRFGCVMRSMSGTGEAWRFSQRKE